MALIKFLGTAAGMPTLGRRHSCLYFDTGEYKFLIDCGEGASQALLEEGIEPDDIDFVFITHWHPDHSSGIFMLLQMWHLQGRSKRLQIFVPENKIDCRKVLDFFYLFTERFSFETSLLFGRYINSYHKFIEPFETDHLDNYADFIKIQRLPNTMKSFGVNIQLDHKKVTYTSDIVQTDCIRKHIQDTDILIIDALHPTAEEILSLADDINDKIYLTHGISEALKDRVKGKSKFVIARDKLVINN